MLEFNENYEPETVQGRDNMKALKTALNQYAHGYYTGVLSGNTIQAEFAVDKLNAVETDEWGRDANGIDIEGALAAFWCLWGKSQ